MSDVNDAIVAWRRELEQTGGMSSDDVTELESHLLQEMDSLQKSGLRLDEAFVIAARRLGHPQELATEYAKNDALLSWRRPAKLVLWGMLLLEAIALCWSVILLVLNFFGLVELLGNTYWMHHISNWGALLLFWSLATNPQGQVARGLARLEAAVRTRIGALLLILGPTIVVLASSALRLTLWWYQTRKLIQIGSPVQVDYFSFNMVMQIILSQMFWTVPVAVMLVILIRSERRLPVAKLATH